MAWNLNADQPLYIQIVNRLKLDIISGKYQPGDKIESVRDLAQIAAVNPNTMQKALQELEKTELIKTQRTNGRYITENQELLQNLKTEILLQYLQDFMERARTFGYTDNEIRHIVDDYLTRGGE